MSSERLEPRENGRVGGPDLESLFIADDWTCASNGCTFRLEVDRRVAVRGFHTCVSEPVTDRDEIDTGLKQVDSRGVAKSVRVNPLARKGGCAGTSQPSVLFQEVSDAESCHGLATTVAEQPLNGSFTQPHFADDSTEDLGRLLPKGTQAFLAALAPQAYMEGAS